MPPKRTKRVRLGTRQEFIGLRLNHLGVIVFNVTLVILRDVISTLGIVCYYLIYYNLQEMDVGLKFTEIEEKRKPLSPLSSIKYNVMI